MPKNSRNGSNKNGLRWFRVTNASRQWEDFYKKRWAFDKVIRTSHGVNCSGSCSWLVYVKDGIVAWELQANDWPQISPDTPNYEPRGCQRGISASWYVYSPIRIKYPYVRGVLWDLYQEATGRGLDPVEAWGSIVEDPLKAKQYKSQRGKGGWRRVTWDQATELAGAAFVYTIKKYGPDRLAGFSPIPAMSMVSFTAGARLINLLGGAHLSFYEWYNDLPHVSPMTWGEQTDVHEAADWFQSYYWIIMGTNLPMTRTPDAHFMTEFKYKGGKMVLLAPNYNDTAKFADTWVPIKPGTDTAFMMALNHVVVKEFFIDRQAPYFQEYVKRYTNLPFLLMLDQKDGYYVPGRLLRASDIEEYSGEENAEWKTLLFDAPSGRLRLPKGSIGFRWEKEPTGNWNLEMVDAVSGEAIDPTLTLLETSDGVAQVAFPDFSDTFSLDLGTTDLSATATLFKRGVPVRKVKMADGSEALVTTAFDLLAAHLGISRGLPGDYPEGYDDPKHYTPGWQERITGVGAETAIQIAREWADTAEKTEGKALIISGSGCTHWYHPDLVHRAGALLCMLTGCVGKNGGGWSHYVGTEKIRNMVAVPGTLASGRDWVRPPRQMNSTSYWYFHTGQWKYDAMSLDSQFVPWAEKLREYNHSADINSLAVRSGWLPFYPQLNENPLDIVQEARAAGAKTDQEVADRVVERIKKGDLKFAINDPDDPKNSPKCVFVWRGNLIGTSMRGHMYALKHLLGTHNNVLGKPRGKGMMKEIDWPDGVNWQEDGPEGKLDLLLDVDFRMQSTANYSDIVLPAAHWYEKYDVTVTDLHSFIHPFQPAVNPPWETKPDWDAFKMIAAKVTELAKKHLPTPVKDLVLTPIYHDAPEELAQPLGEIKDWRKGEVEPIPGKTMPKMNIVERDYTKILDMYTSFGPLVAQKAGYGIKGINYDLTEIYEGLKTHEGIGAKNGCPSMETDRQVAEIICQISPETNGESSHLAWESLEAKHGRPLTDIIEGEREARINYSDLSAQPRRVLTSPYWQGLEAPGRTYSPYTLNIEKLFPWRTLTGRQDIYLDHQAFREMGIVFPLWKPPVDTVAIGDVALDELAPGSKVFRFLTPHGKWAIHSTFIDTWQMLSMFRGGPVIWMNPEDAAEIGVEDNDWVEAYSQNGIAVARAVVSQTMPRDSVIMYHSQERHVNVPLSKLAEERGLSDRRGGNNNAPTRIFQNPAYMIGGYAQISYSMNYWGTSPAERDMSVAIRKMPLATQEEVQYR
ncbi:MAG: nitrate reductase subunit alpha [Armatimonadetes bacterium]|nr:nitrate reductase subunit alpha [Armatimonadota bacterium]